MHLIFTVTLGDRQHYCPYFTEKLAEKSKYFSKAEKLMVIGKYLTKAWGPVMESTGSQTCLIHSSSSCPVVP